MADLVDPYSPICPHHIRFEVMRMWWRNLTFIHWPVEPSDVQALLPEGLSVDTHEGQAWVGLVPFEMEVQLPGGIPIPREGRFPETNVRTYVVGPDGTPGVWFHSLEAGRLSATAMARAAYGLPYFWADMSATAAGPVWAYRSQRRWPGPKGASNETAIEVGERIDDADQTPLEHFLTARWGLFSTFGKGDRERLLYAPVEHGVWPLHQATVVHLRDELVTSAGYRAQESEPLVHFTTGTEVRIGRPQLVRTS